MVLLDALIDRISQFGRHLVGGRIEDLLLDRGVNPQSSIICETRRPAAVTSSDSEAFLNRAKSPFTRL